MSARFTNLAVSLSLALLSSLFGAGSSADPAVAPPALSLQSLDGWCTELQAAIDGFRWRDVDACKQVSWKADHRSVEGRPLVYAEFGDPKSDNVTLIFTAVHGDEITPVYLGLRLARWLKENSATLQHARVVIAPLVNPDGFYKKPRTRMNAHGVDVNRNFDTRDWNERAVTAWKKSFQSDPRRFPGNAAGSEPETRFQEDLIGHYRPKKILSVHSPLNHLDYDGPNQLSLAKFPRDYVQECIKLRTKLKAVSAGFFPGSLGNYAGQEKGIPTITLELPTANSNMAGRYWKIFSSGIQTMIQFVIPEPESQAEARGESRS